ncbi:nuclear transport factor 2 family protein [Streptomyces umbrinus]|uniref:nuclear transport factor 2 family protein n=1 Tax=Streptomyces umbrinus TaxID=67370 RepID=UPI0033F421C5
MPDQRLIIARLFLVIDAQDWATLPDLFTETAQYERPGYPPLHGRAAIDRFYREQRIVACGTHHLHGCITGTSEVCCWGSFTGVSRTGEPLNELFSDWYEIDHGLIATRRTFFFQPAI